MVFCITRSIAETTAEYLAHSWFSDRVWPAPKDDVHFKNKNLQAAGKCGVAFHHAGLEPGDRVLVEKQYVRGNIQVICCTSTLAVGINLPAHLVVIKNTVTWVDGVAKEYFDLEVLQMLGRAGRPQFDNTGVAVILTRKDNQERYEKMASGKEPLESW